MELKNIIDVKDVINDNVYIKEKNVNLYNKIIRIFLSSAPCF